MEIHLMTLAFCSGKHDSKNICLLCTRMICFEETCGIIFSDDIVTVVKEQVGEILFRNKKVNPN